MRVRKNFMIKSSVLKEMEQLIPKGEWSGFVNTALEEAMIDFSRKKASELIDKFRNEKGLKLPSDNELKKQIRYGLE